MNIKEAQALIENQEAFNSPEARKVVTKGMYAPSYFIPVALINSEIAVVNKRTHKMTFKNLNRFVAYRVSMTSDGVKTISTQTVEIAIANVQLSGKAGA
jgi:hypothetical protein